MVIVGGSGVFSRHRNLLLWRSVWRPCVRNRDKLY